jgi:hypothetical protein
MRGNNKQKYIYFKKEKKNTLIIHHLKKTHPDTQTHTPYVHKKKRFVASEKKKRSVCVRTLKKLYERKKRRPI